MSLKIQKAMVIRTDGDNWIPCKTKIKEAMMTLTLQRIPF